MINQAQHTIDVKAYIQALLVATLEVDEADINLETDIRTDLGADSLDIVQMIMALGMTFTIPICDKEVMSLHTVGDVIAYIEKQMAYQFQLHGARSFSLN